MSPRRQTKMRTRRSRSRKAPSILDTDFEREGCNRADTRHGHQTAADCILFDHLLEHSVQPFEAFEDGPPHIEHGFNGRDEDRIAPPEQLADARFLTASANRSNQQSIGPERATNVVFNVDQFALEELPVGQQRAHLLHLDVLDMDGATPAQSHYLREPPVVFHESFLLPIDPGKAPGI
jgi:hypothetical protein